MNKFIIDVSIQNVFHGLKSSYKPAVWYYM